jgi:8-oxo-dGTP pyrophosphatase MutT (NUDIX family)
LVHKCFYKEHGHYCTLPGGGQHQYETLHETVVRECLEETGYTVIPVRFAALCEEISMDEKDRKENPDLTHKIYHIFVCELTDKKIKEPTEKDITIVNSEWIKIDDLDDLKHVRTLPRILGKNIRSIIENTAPIFLGSEYMI